MENYYDNPAKYNKVLWKYLGLKDKETDLHPEEVNENFKPEEHYEILRWIMHKIKKSPRPGYLIRILIGLKADETEVYIQEWYDIKNAHGHVDVVRVSAKKEHEAIYNACVNYVLKTQ